MGGGGGVVGGGGWVVGEGRGGRVDGHTRLFGKETMVVSLLD